MIICDNRVIDELLDSDILNNASGDQMQQSPNIIDADSTPNERHLKSNLVPSISLNMDGDAYLDKNIFLV
jgi:hypothetical protein